MKATRLALALVCAAALVAGCGGNRVAAPPVESPPAPQPPPDPGPLIESVFSIVEVGPAMVAGIFEGIARTTDQGASWVIVRPEAVFDLATDGTRIFAASRLGALRSLDGGLTWELIDTGLPLAAGMSSIVVEGNTLAAVIWVENLVGYSTDAGDHWNVIDLPGDLRAASVLLHDGALYVGTSETGVLRSNDGGQTWQVLRSGFLQEGGIYTLAAHGGRLFAGTRWHGNLFVSDDNGATWQLSRNGLAEDRGIYSIRSHGSELFAGTGGGVFRSTDNGANWSRLPFDPFPYTTVMELEQQTGSMFAATLSHGVHRSTDGGATWTRVHDLGTKGDPVIYLDDPASPVPPR